MLATRAAEDICERARVRASDTPRPTSDNLGESCKSDKSARLPLTARMSTRVSTLCGGSAQTGALSNASNNKCASSADAANETKLESTRALVAQSVSELGAASLASYARLCEARASGKLLMLSLGVISAARTRALQSLGRHNKQPSSSIAQSSACNQNPRPSYCSASTFSSSSSSSQLPPASSSKRHDRHAKVPQVAAR